MFASILFGLATAWAHPAVDATTQQLMHRADFEKVVISPDGARLAVASHTDEGTMITVMNRQTLQAEFQINPGSRGEVSSLDWLGSSHLIVAANRADRAYGVALGESTLYLVTIGQSHPIRLPVSFAGTIEGNDHEILVESCDGYDNGECKLKISRVDIDHFTATGTTVAVAPAGSADVTLDHQGKVRFAVGVDKEANEKLFVHGDDDKWTVLNDSKVSGAYVLPMGISRDNTTAFLITEHKDGPDSIDAYVLSSGARKELLRDKVSDPLGVISSTDQLEPIGTWLGPGVPTARFWNEDDNEVKWRKMLNQSFPGVQTEITSASERGDVMVVRTTGDRDPGTYYLLDRGTNKARILFHAKPSLDPARQLPATPVALTARDGLPLHGFITLPAMSAALPPMVVMVHGGPFFIRDSWGYDEETQVLAQHGYAVLRINFRGSSGFGKPFMQRGYGQWGTGMQDDVTDATRWAINQGLADGHRVCIYGGSYGGYAALMAAIREPGLYRCAAGLAGVYDLNRLYSWGDIYRSDYGLKYLQTVLGTDKAQLSQRSPSDHAAEITIPVFLAHGDLDGRVPIKHARELRKAMTKAGHEPLYTEYEFEGHGLALEADQVDFYSKLLMFLDANTAPGGGSVAGASP
jgi:dipeptidyl aminopeptidase/acylaminoacyl peptidase